MGFLWLLLAKGFAQMHIFTAGFLHSQILMQGAMDSVTAPRRGTELVDCQHHPVSSQLTMIVLYLWKADAVGAR